MLYFKMWILIYFEIYCKVFFIARWSDYSTLKINHCSPFKRFFAFTKLMNSLIKFKGVKKNKFINWSMLKCYFGEHKIWLCQKPVWWSSMWWKLSCSIAPFLSLIKLLNEEWQCSSLRIRVPGSTSPLSLPVVMWNRRRL